MDKVIEERENVQRIFEKLRFYVDNFKPIDEIEPEHRDKMVRFVNQAYSCHLKKKTEKEREREQEEEESKVFHLINQFLSHISILMMWYFKRTIRIIHIICFSEKRESVER